MKFIKENEKGFSLIELAIVLVVMSLALTSALSLWRVQSEGKGLGVTRQNLQTAQDALKSYVAMNGVYPCPAPRGLDRDDPAFGRAPAECEKDSSTATISRTDLRKTLATAKGRHDFDVKIGLLPFRSLGIPDSSGVDGWGNILQYAVTEKLTIPGRFHPRDGAIDVVAGDEQSRLTPPQSAQYVVFSAGMNGAGGFTANGQPSAQGCPKKMLETENCDDDAVFMDTERQQSAPKARVNDPAQAVSAGSQVSYDDRIVYLQYDPSLQAKGGIVYYFADNNCPQGFEEVTLLPDTVSDIETLTIYSQADPRYREQQYVNKNKLCASTMYAQKMEIRSPPLNNEGESKSHCPQGWTTIGYSFFSVGVMINREICAR